MEPLPKNEKKKVANSHIYGIIKCKVTTPLSSLNFTARGPPFETLTSPLRHSKNFQNTSPLDLTPPSLPLKKNLETPMDTLLAHFSITTTPVMRTETA